MVNTNHELEELESLVQKIWRIPWLSHFKGENEVLIHWNWGIPYFQTDILAAISVGGWATSNEITNQNMFFLLKHVFPTFCSTTSFLKKCGCVPIMPIIGPKKEQQMLQNRITLMVPSDGRKAV